MANLGVSAPVQQNDVSLLSTFSLSKGCWRQSTIASLKDHQRSSLIYREHGSQWISSSYQHIIQRCQFQQVSLLYGRYRNRILIDVGKFIGNSPSSSLLCTCPHLQLISNIYRHYLLPLHLFPPSSLHFTRSTFAPPMTDVPTALILWLPDWYPTQTSDLWC